MAKTKHNYMIDGKGNTIEAANRSLGSKRGDLTKKFKDAGIPTETRVVETRYEGRFNLRGECKGTACTTQFTVKSREGWDAVMHKATRSANGETGNYDTSFSVEEYLALTKAQEKALEPKRTGPSMYETRESPLARLA